MRGLRKVLLAACLTPLSSAAAQFAMGTAGILGGVAVSPQPISVGAPATILLSGAGECGQVTVNFGDGTSKTLTGVKFASNAQTQHTYSRAGSLTITALAGSNCNAKGEVKTSLIVEGSYAEILCALTGCDEPTRRETPCSTPTIRSVSYAWPLEPKENVTLHGCGFGRALQQVRLKLPLPSPGTGAALQVLSWSDTDVTASVPALTGVRDQTGRLQVVLGAGRTLVSSNEVPVSFRATRELRWLYNYLIDHPTLVQQQLGVIQYYCSQAASGNTCDSFHGVDQTFAGNHCSPTSDVIKGMDWYTITLGNGWVFQKYTDVDMTWWLKNPPYVSPNICAGLNWVHASAGDASLFTPGAPSGVVRVAWALGARQATTYAGLVQVKGPVGVPFK